MQFNRLPSATYFLIFYELTVKNKPVCDDKLEMEKKRCLESKRGTIQRVKLNESFMQMTFIEWCRERDWMMMMVHHKLHVDDVIIHLVTIIIIHYHTSWESSCSITMNNSSNCSRKTLCGTIYIVPWTLPLYVDYLYPILKYPKSILKLRDMGDAAGTNKYAFKDINEKCFYSRNVNAFMQQFWV